MLYIFVKTVSRMVYLLPRPVKRGLGFFLGEVCWLIVPRRRRTMAVANIRRGLELPEDEALVIAKRSVTRFGWTIMEVLGMAWLTRAKIDREVKLIGVEHLKAALAYGRGAVIPTSHSGNWELLGSVLALHGLPLVAIAQKQTNAAMDRFINEYRTKAGMHVTYKTGLREMIRLLGEGKSIGILMDQDAGDKGVFVNFFGRPASTPPGAAYLARLKNAPIVPAFITNNPDGTHTAFLHPAIWPDQTADREADIKNTTQRLTAVIEDHIRRYPADWFWLHNRWKHQP